jgi:predicted Zn-dependent protease
LQKCLELRANWIPAVGTLALIDVSQGKAADAFARIADLKRAAPREPAVPMLEGDVHMSLKQYAEAARAFDAAFAMEPTAQSAMKSYRARQLGKLGDAAQPLEAWLKRKPDDFAARSALADAYRLAGQRSRAIAQYEVLTSRGPLNVAALNNLAWLYHEERDARAETTARRAYGAAPNIPAVADTYGWILMEAGRAGEALPVLQRAAAGAKGHPDIDYHYAAALAATGAAGEARKLLTRVLDHPEPFASRADAERLLERLPQS